MYTLLRSIGILVDLIEILIIIRIFINIFKMPMNNIFGKVLFELTDPLLSPASALLQKLGLDKGFIDFSPWVAIILLRFFYFVLIRTLG